MNLELKTLRNLLLVSGFLIGVAVWIFVAAPSSMLVKIVDDVFPLLVNILGAGLAYGIFRRQAQSHLKASVWGAMTLGLVCWALGEAIWAVYELVLMQEIPYPSVADLVWLIGYVPLFLSVGLQHRSLRTSVSRRGMLLMAMILSGMAVLVVWFVITPILVNPESGTPMESFFTLAYPICDLFLFSITMVLVLVFFGGQLALSWGVIAAGILLLSISNLLFSYGTWNGLYYPDGHLNFLSALFDILYISAYVVWDIGLFLRLRLPDPGKDVDLQKYIPEAGKDFLLMADNRGRVVFLDPALLPVLGLKDSAEGAAKTFGQLFGLPRAYEDAAMRKAAKTGISDDYTITLGLSRIKYRLRAVASSDPQQFPGFDILLHPDAQRSAPDRDPETILLGQVADRARQPERTRRFSTEEHPLRVYFNTLVDLLFILVSRAGGTGVGAAFETDVNEKARQAGCKFELRSGRAICNEAVTEPGTYRDLLEEAVRYANQVISASTIGRKLEEIEQFMDPALVREAEEHRLRRARWPKEESG